MSDFCPALQWRGGAGWGVDSKTSLMSSPHSLPSEAETLLTLRPRLGFQIFVCWWARWGEADGSEGTFFTPSFLLAVSKRAVFLVLDIVAPPMMPGWGFLAALLASDA